MKKHIYKIGLLVVILASVLVGCEEDTVTYSGENFVSLDDVESTGLSVRENAGILNIPVNLAFSRPDDVVVTFTDSSSVAIPGVHYTLLTPGSVTIPAGETTANIQIQIIDNEDIDESRPVYIKLRTISDDNVSLGLVDEGSYSKRVLIVNNDCTTNFDIWFGDLDVSSTAGSVLGSAKADFNDNGDCNILTISGLLQNNVGEPDSSIKFTFTPSAPNSTTGTVVATEQLYQAGGYSEGGIDYDIKYTATGTYNEVTKKLTITGHAFISLGSFTDSVLVLTPVE